MKLKAKHIISAGGTHYTDKHNTKWIDLDIEEDSRSKFRFYDTGKGFNVYVIQKEQLRAVGIEKEYYPMVQFVFLRSWIKFKILCWLKKYQ